MLSIKSNWQEKCSRQGHPGHWGINAPMHRGPYKPGWAVPVRLKAQGRHIYMTQWGAGPHVRESAPLRFWLYGHGWGSPFQGDGRGLSRGGDTGASCPHGGGGRGIVVAYCGFAIAHPTFGRVCYGATTYRSPEVRGLL